MLASTAAHAQAPSTGAALFKQHFQMCHVSSEQASPGVGPTLFGVVGRPAASTAYPYSSALKAFGLRWDSVTLDRFLSGPSRLVPGTKMPVAIDAPEQRAAIIAYLATLKR